LRINSQEGLGGCATMADQPEKIIENLIENANKSTFGCKLLIKDQEIDFFCPEDFNEIQKEKDIEILLSNFKKTGLINPTADKHRKDIIKILRNMRKQSKKGIPSKPL
jgi:hypothetical protein